MLAKVSRVTSQGGRDEQETSVDDGIWGVKQLDVFNNTFLAKEPGGPQTSSHQTVMQGFSGVLESLKFQSGAVNEYSKIENIFKYF